MFERAHGGTHAHALNNFLLNSQGCCSCSPARWLHMAARGTKRDGAETGTNDGFKDWKRSWWAIDWETKRSLQGWGRQQVIDGRSWSKLLHLGLCCMCVVCRRASYFEKKTIFFISIFKRYVLNVWEFLLVCLREKSINRVFIGCCKFWEWVLWPLTWNIIYRPLMFGVDS